jgi:hypothetical protein
MLWIRPLMPRLPEKLLLLALLATIAVGCKPKIGDDCQISTDCSAAGDRLCDITAPGGYCTVYNCEPGSCPEDESLCVLFGAERSPVAECKDPQAQSPYARTFCMATCESDSDCRDDYVCANLNSHGGDWGAILVDGDRGDRACMVKLDAGVKAPSGENQPAGFGDACHASLPSTEEAPSAGGAGG